MRRKLETAERELYFLKQDLRYKKEMAKVNAEKEWHEEKEQKQKDKEAAKNKAYDTYKANWNRMSFFGKLVNGRVFNRSKHPDVIQKNFKSYSARSLEDWNSKISRK